MNNQKKDFKACDICSSNSDEATHFKVGCDLCNEYHNLCSMCYELGHNENTNGRNGTGVYWNIK